MDYNKFLEDCGITPKDIVCTIRPYCKNFSKSQVSMIRSPEKYGVCLLPYWDKRLIEVFGKTEPSEEKEQAPKKTPNRKKPERFTFRLTKKKADKLRKIRAKLGVTTQELVCDVMENYIENFKLE